MRQTLERDPAAVDRFVERMRCVPRLLRIVNGRMGNLLSHDDLADLAQDTLVLTWKKLGTYEGRATLETWVHHICYFEFMNRARARLRLDRRGGGDLEADPPVAETPASPVEFEHLELALRELGPPEADVIRLKHFEDLTFGEIGDVLQVPPNTAKTRYYRGIDWLRRHLSAADAGEAP